MAKDEDGFDLTEENPGRADQLRAILAASSRWAGLVSKLPLLAIAKHEPVNFDGCTAEEAISIARWAMGEGTGVPPRLAVYLDSVKAG